MSFLPTSATNGTVAPSLFAGMFGAQAPAQPAAAPAQQPALQQPAQPLFPVLPPQPQQGNAAPVVQANPAVPDPNPQPQQPAPAQGAPAVAVPPAQPAQAPANPPAQAPLPAALAAPPGGPKLALPKQPPFGNDETLGSILDAWRSEVARQRDAFAEQSRRVVKWDEQLRHARIQVLTLNAEVEELKAGKVRAEAALTLIESHQTAMGQRLDEIEQYMDAVMSRGTKDWARPGAGVIVTSAQRNRAAAYTTALQIDSTLSGLSKQLNEVKRAVEAEVQAKSDDPLAQIKQLLNEEISSLKEVERRSAEILQQARDLTAKGMTIMGR